MLFKRLLPDPELEKLIECYWVVEDSSKAIRQQKIIPDGFTEIIIHSGDQYKIRLTDCWELQSNYLLAGQIDKYFYLENTGVSDILGIKLKPTALTRLFNLNMVRLTNKVIDLNSVHEITLEKTIGKLKTTVNHDEKIELLNQFFCNMVRQKTLQESPVDKAVEIIFENHGMIAVAPLSNLVNIGERQLENLFKKFVGMPPKLFSRIIRFNYIFQLVENHKGWSAVAYEAAYHDQSHFIRNFKNFTGENPADYAFDEKNMANFFLKK